MVLRIGEQQWHLHFHTVAVNNQKLWDMETHCFVHTGPCIWTHVEPKYCINGVRGVARCSKKDQFVKRVAHRLALTRAIEHLPEFTRERIWMAYWTRVRRPKESPEKFKSRLARLAIQQPSTEAQSSQPSA